MLGRDSARCGGAGGKAAFPRGRSIEGGLTLDTPTTVVVPSGILANGWARGAGAAFFAGTTSARSGGAGVAALEEASCLPTRTIVRGLRHAKHVGSRSQGTLARRGRIDGLQMHDWHSHGIIATTSQGNGGSGTCNGGALPITSTLCSEAGSLGCGADGSSGRCHRCSYLLTWVLTRSETRNAIR